MSSGIIYIMYDEHDESWEKDPRNFHATDGIHAMSSGKRENFAYIVCRAHHGRSEVVYIKMMA